MTRCSTRPTANANIVLALKLAIFCVLLFAATFLIGELVVQCLSSRHGT